MNMINKMHKNKLIQINQNMKKNAISSVINVNN